MYMYVCESVCVEEKRDELRGSCLDVSNGKQCVQEREREREKRKSKKKEKERADWRNKGKRWDILSMTENDNKTFATIVL